jgi:hypothetical protein
MVYLRNISVDTLRKGDTEDDSYDNDDDDDNNNSNNNNNNNNKIITWIDYQKPFDNIPRIWVEKSIELVGVNSKILEFVNYLWRNGVQNFF